MADAKIQDENMKNAERKERETISSIINHPTIADEWAKGDGLQIRPELFKKIHTT